VGLSVRARERALGFSVGLGCGLLFKDLGLRNLVSYWGPLTTPVLVGGLLGAALWTTKLRGILVATMGLLVVIWGVVAYSPLVLHLARGLVRVDAARRADAIFVFSSNVQPDDEPSAQALARATRGLELLGQGLAPRLYLSELRPPAGSYVRYLRASAARMGLAVAEIDSVGFVYNTHDEAIRVAELARAHGWQTILAVTSPVHSRRAAAVLEHAGVPEVISVPSVETLYDVDGLRTSEDRIVAFGPVVHEWVGLWIYRLRGWR
jgi:uncharacterized SAM-binding protein YcdF (DUF218 family)